MTPKPAEPPIPHWPFPSGKEPSLIDCMRAAAANQSLPIGEAWELLGSAADVLELALRHTREQHRDNLDALKALDFLEALL
jgi:hypothetical protein